MEIELVLWEDNVFIHYRIILSTHIYMYTGNTNNRINKKRKPTRLNVTILNRDDETKPENISRFSVSIIDNEWGKIATTLAGDAKSDQQM